MKAAGVILVLLAACTGGGVGDDSYPVTPPGVGGQGTDTGGGGSGDGSGGNTILTAHVCLLGDSTQIDVCAAKVPAKIKVSLRTMGDPKGPFLTPDNQSGLVTTTPASSAATYWQVGVAGDPVVFASLVPYNGADSKTAAGQKVPVFLLDDYTRLTNINPPPIKEDEGAIFIQVLDEAGKPVAGAKATLAPAPEVTWYAGTTLDAWNQDAATGTTARGLIWVPGLAGGVSETISIAAGAKLGTATQVVTAQYTTFITIRLK